MEAEKRQTAPVGATRLLMIVAFLSRGVLLLCLAVAFVVTAEPPVLYRGLGEEMFWRSVAAIRGQFPADRAPGAGARRVAVGFAPLQSFAAGDLRSG